LEGERRGISESPELEFEDYKNKTTGKTEKVPKGIQPGFNYNPGKHRDQRIKEVLKEAQLKQSKTEKELNSALKKVKE